MVDALKATFVILLLTIAFVVYPTLRTAEKHEETTRNIARNAVVTFVDTTRGKGYVDVRDYNQLLRSLDASGGVFEVTLERYQKLIQPTYTNPEDYTTFQHTFTVRYDGYFTSEILQVLFPSTNSPDDDPVRRYNMHAGDLFNVRIESKGTTLAGRMRSLLFHGTNIPIIERYGGMVRSEAP
ncbi:hypothetical protein EJP82_25965 [Paenibacillus anaericanus]|uniref:Uncharacterized protein n=1 Tax=Paenibacillus anaericanus TaxID=170367 RepID=A0A3S1BHA7_9BACL|nr:hypothetical protein [Paenibacillus anaericanus]RUT39529.1 hypothetical protein EJP82_25965 [Paenibacillus anaericanus]